MSEIYYTFDFLSPFSYLTWKVLDRKKSNYSHHQVILRPVTMAMVIRHYQPAGPAEIPVKRDYLTRECLRISALENIPFQAPLKLPFISTDLLRAVCALENEREWQWKLTDLLFSSIWEYKKDPEDLDAILDSMDLPEDIRLKCNEAGARRILKANTKQAIDEKLFGVPAFSVYQDGDLKDIFWGLNSMNHLDLFLEDKLQIDSNTESDFKSLFPGN